jgi:oxazoline/thiazoline dehydrogenase
LRPVPSAGATHPFDLLVTVDDVIGLGAGRYVFDAHAVGLRRLGAQFDDFAGTVELAALRASRCATPAPVTVTLVADVRRVTRRYRAALTLLLRDAGALVQTLHLVATDLGLAGSILGSAGHSPETGEIAVTEQVVNCGAFIFGAPPAALERNGSAP